MNLREMAEAWLRANDWDYKKYGDRRSDRSAYDGLMNYEISSLLEEVYIAGALAVLEKVRPVLEEIVKHTKGTCVRKLGCAECAARVLLEELKDG